MTVDIHPTKPLVVTTDRKENIIVWNYDSKSIVYKTSTQVLGLVNSSWLDAVQRLHFIFQGAGKIRGSPFDEAVGRSE